MTHDEGPQFENALIDRLGRVHTNLRLSVTDRCNIRCFYCMPAENVEYRPHEELLHYEEIVRFTRVATTVGINKLRITGGEPLVRRDLHTLIAELAKLPGIEDLALTTNGMLLGEQAELLKAAGLKRLNISLDTLREETFQRIARRPGVQQVLDGILEAQRVGFQQIRLNALAIAGLTEQDVVPLAEFSRSHGFELRFIEFMPLSAEDVWDSERVLTGKTLRRLLEEAFGPLVPAKRNDPHQPAVDYQFADGQGKIGLINPVSEPFCGNCNRLRLTAEGQIRNCLFATREWDARAILRGEADDDELRKLLRDCVAAKQPAHGIGADDFEKPQRAMYQIGG
ncbi:MAG: GTP 3',8-cyclase MoaA [Pirellulales bacterium]|nr:GTP 3',8-cyclase MoaA [Pirellulales bacterium]